jgi:hypothetical protein
VILAFDGRLQKGPRPDRRRCASSFCDNVGEKKARTAAVGQAWLAACTHGPALSNLASRVGRSPTSSGDTFINICDLRLSNLTSVADWFEIVRHDSDHFWSASHYALSLCSARCILA